MNEKEKIYHLELVPKHYNVKSHFFDLLYVPIMTTLCIIFFDWTTIVHSYNVFSPINLLALPALLLIIPLSEWVIHKLILHKVGHHKIHHQLFSWKEMSLRRELFEEDEYYYVLSPLKTKIYTSFGLLILNIIVSLLFGEFIAAIITVAALLYYISYEILHYAFHSPKNHWLNKFAFVRYLGQLHTLHHHPDLSQNYNFNVIFPIFDIVFGTYFKNTYTFNKVDIEYNKDVNSVIFKLKNSIVMNYNSQDKIDSNVIMGFDQLGRNCFVEILSPKEIYLNDWFAHPLRSRIAKDILMIIGLWWKDIDYEKTN